MNLLDQFDSILAWFDKLQGLPAAGLVFVFCIAIGYAWRGITLKWFPNDAIPMVVMITGALSMMLIADGRPTTMPHHVWTVRNLVVGFIIGAIAWAAHNWVLYRIEEWIKSKFPAVSNTAFFTKQDPPKPPVAPEPPKP